MGRKRIRYGGYGNKNVGRAFGIVWTIVSVFFMIMGFSMLNASGLFGLVWIVMSVAFVGFGIALIAKDGQGLGPEYIIEDMDDAPSPAAGSAEERLARLRDLYERRVITSDEYEAQRAEIIKDI